MVESSSCKRAVCCFSVSVSGSMGTCTCGGGRTTDDAAGFTSKKGARLDRSTFDRSEDASGEEARKLAALPEVRGKSNVGKFGEADSGRVDSGVIFGAAGCAAGAGGSVDFDFEAPSKEEESRG